MNEREYDYVISAVVSMSQRKKKQHFIVLGLV